MFSQIWPSFTICTDKDVGWGCPPPIWLGPWLKQWMSDLAKLTQEVVSEESIKLESALQTEDSGISSTCCQT